MAFLSPAQQAAQYGQNALANIFGGPSSTSSFAMLGLSDNTDINSPQFWRDQLEFYSRDPRAITKSYVNTIIAHSNLVVQFFETVDAYQAAGEAGVSFALSGDRVDWKTRIFQPRLLADLAPNSPAPNNEPLTFVSSAYFSRKGIRFTVPATFAMKPGAAGIWAEYVNTQNESVHITREYAVLQAIMASAGKNTFGHVMSNGPLSSIDLHRQLGAMFNMAAPTLKSGAGSYSWAGDLTTPILKTGRAKREDLAIFVGPSAAKMDIFNPNNRIRLTFGGAEGFPTRVLEVSRTPDGIPIIPTGTFKDDQGRDISPLHTKVCMSERFVFERDESRPQNASLRTAHQNRQIPNWERERMETVTTAFLLKYCGIFDPKTRKVSNRYQEIMRAAMGYNPDATEYDASESNQPIKKTRTVEGFSERHGYSDNLAGEFNLWRCYESCRKQNYIVRTITERADKALLETLLAAAKAAKNPDIPAGATIGSLMFDAPTIFYPVSIPNAANTSPYKYTPAELTNSLPGLVQGKSPPEIQDKINASEREYTNQQKATESKTNTAKEREAANRWAALHDFDSGYFSQYTKAAKEDIYAKLDIFLGYIPYTWDVAMALNDHNIEQPFNFMTFRDTEMIFEAAICAASPAGRNLIKEAYCSYVRDMDVNELPFQASITSATIIGHPELTSANRFMFPVGRTSGGGLHPYLVGYDDASVRDNDSDRRVKDMYVILLNGQEGSKTLPTYVDKRGYYNPSLTINASSALQYSTAKVYDSIWGFSANCDQTAHPFTESEQRYSEPGNATLTVEGYMLVPTDPDGVHFDSALNGKGLFPIGNRQTFQAVTGNVDFNGSYISSAGALTTQLVA